MVPAVALSLVCLAGPAHQAIAETESTGVPVEQSSDAPQSSRVRSSDSRIRALFDEGSARSPTFRKLLEAISRSNGIVYVEFGYCAFGHLNGCLLPFVAALGGARYLRVIV